MLFQHQPNITVCGPVIGEQCTQKLIFPQAVIIRGGRWARGPSPQTRDVDIVLVYCWASIADSVC